MVVTMMACKKCGALLSGGKCPVCGYEQPPNDIAEAMKSLIDQQGTEIILHPKQFYGMLADTLPQHQQEKALARRVMLDSTCYQEMAAVNQAPDAKKSLCILHSLAVLESQHFMSRENAAKALIWLATALEWDASTYEDCLRKPAQTSPPPVEPPPVKAPPVEPPPVKAPSGNVQKASPSGFQNIKQTVSVKFHKALETLLLMLRKLAAFLFLAFLWVMSVSTFMTALSSVIVGDIRSSIILTIAGLLVLPPVYQKIRKIKAGSVIALLLFFVLLVVAVW